MLKKYWFTGLFLMFAVAVALQVVVASAAPKEQVKSFTCDDKKLAECAVSVDKAVNEWLAENPSVVIVDRKVSVAVAAVVVPQVSSLAYAVTIFYSGGKP